jgi:hypothetical protein
MRGSASAEAQNNYTSAVPAHNGGRWVRGPKSNTCFRFRYQALQNFRDISIVCTIPKLSRVLFLGFGGACSLYTTNLIVVWIKVLGSAELSRRY